MKSSAMFEADRVDKAFSSILLYLQVPLMNSVKLMTTVLLNQYLVFILHRADLLIGLEDKDNAASTLKIILSFLNIIVQ